MLDMAFLRGLRSTVPGERFLNPRPEDTLPIEWHYADLPLPDELFKPFKESEEAPKLDTVQGLGRKVGDAIIGITSHYASDSLARLHFSLIQKDDGDLRALYEVQEIKYDPKVTWHNAQYKPRVAKP